MLLLVTEHSSNVLMKGVSSRAMRSWMTKLPSNRSVPTSLCSFELPFQGAFFFLRPPHTAHFFTDCSFHISLKFTVPGKLSWTLKKKTHLPLPAAHSLPLPYLFCIALLGIRNALQLVVSIRKPITRPPSDVLVNLLLI